MIVVLIIYGILIIVNICLVIVFSKKTQKLNKLYEKTLHKFDGDVSTKDTFDRLFERLTEIENFCNQTNENMENCKDKVKDSISRVGIVKYSALEDSNNLSFAIAQMNDEKTGFILNHVFSKHGSTIYVKKINKGIVTERMSEEEAEALKIASEKESFSIDEPFFKPTISKVKSKKKK